ncbi:MAG: FecR domain-containing protein [Sphingomonas sp.]
MAWVVRLTSGEATPEDHARFRNWRDASAENAEALVRARTLWNTLGSTLPEIERKRERALARWRRVGRALPIAASLVIAIGLGNQYRQVWQYDAVTGTGEHRSIVLADGSKVVLGADAALSDHYNGVERRLTLARGQAFFQVRHDARRPFIVQTDQGEVRDVGTAFTIALADDRTRVLVVDGIVEGVGRSSPPSADGQSGNRYFHFRSWDGFVGRGRHRNRVDAPQAAAVQPAAGRDRGGHGALLSPAGSSCSIAPWRTCR